MLNLSLSSPKFSSTIGALKTTLSVKWDVQAKENVIMFKNEILGKCLCIIKKKKEKKKKKKQSFDKLYKQKWSDGCFAEDK